MKIKCVAQITAHVLQDKCLAVSYFHNASAQLVDQSSYISDCHFRSADVSHSDQLFNGCQQSIIVWNTPVTKAYFFLTLTLKSRKFSGLLSHSQAQAWIIYCFNLNINDRLCIYLQLILSFRLAVTSEYLFGYPGHQIFLSEQCQPLRFHKHTTFIIFKHDRKRGRGTNLAMPLRQLNPGKSLRGGGASKGKGDSVGVLVQDPEIHLSDIQHPVTPPWSLSAQPILCLWHL